jgi:hypothetical protein
VRSVFAEVVRTPAHYSSQFPSKHDLLDALDLRLIFAATRASAQLESGAWRRMLELGIDALQAEQSKDHS